MHLGRGAIGRATRFGVVFLLDGDRWRDPLDRVHQRLLHPVEELLRIGRERLDVPPLSLREQCVQRERGLARAGWPGHDDDLPSRNIEVESLEVVLPGAQDADRLVHMVR